MLGFDKVKEVNYITNERNEFYRPIMRYLYLQAIERVGDFISQREIVDHVKSLGFIDYDIQTNDRDLESLKSWKNLTIIQDTSRPESIDSYKKASKLCQITPGGMLVEEFLIKREEAKNSPGGSLEGTAFQNLAYLLRRYEEAVRRNNWEEATTHFANAFQLFESILTEASKFFQMRRPPFNRHIKHKDSMIFLRIA